MPDFILAIDQGTTGSTALLIGHDLSVHGHHTVDFPQYFPKPGWVEHDPDEIWGSVRQAIVELLESTGVTTSQVMAIGITNQRETTVLWDRADNRPATNAIVWQCRRSTDICKRLKSQGLEELYHQRTGLVLDPYFSGTKLTWLFEESTSLKRRAEEGHLAFGTIDSFLVWRLTGGKTHITDVSNASRTLMMDLQDLTWNDDLLAPLGVPEAVLPEIVSSSSTYGKTRGLDFLPDGIPVAGMAGDQQAALFGQACFEPGQSKCTYGTGAFILENVGDRPLFSKHGLLTTVAWQLDGKTSYALEGSTFIAGAAVQWLRDGLGLIKTSAEVEALANQVADNNGVVFVPALTGLGAPHWKSEVRGQILGLTRGTTAAHIARATLEGIALQVYDLIMAMTDDRGRPGSILKVDGGAARNNLMMQMQADLIGRPVSRPGIVETTALGAAMLAGLAIGFWNGTDELAASWQEERCFEPRDDKGSWREALLEQWREAITKM
jgi:glycerol kinase